MRTGEKTMKKSLSYRLLFILWLSVLLIPTSLPIIAVSAKAPLTYKTNQLTLVDTIGRGSVSSIAWSPNDSLIAVGSSVGVWLYDIDSHSQPPQTVIPETRWVSDVTFSPDGEYIGIVQSTSLDGNEILIWNVELDQEQTSWQTDKFTRSIMFSPDGEMLVSLHSEGNIQMRNIVSGAIVHEWSLSSDLEIHLIFEPDNRLLAFTWEFDNNTLSRWYLGDETPEFINAHQGSSQFAVSFQANKLLLAEYSDSTIRLIDFETSEVLLTRNTSLEIYQIIFREQTILVTYEGGVRLWDIETGDIVGETQATIPQDDIWFNSAGEQIAFRDRHIIWIWDITTDQEIAQLDEFYGLINDIEFNPLRPVLAVGYTLSPGTKGFIRLWNIARRPVEYTDIIIGEQIPNALTFDPSGDHLVYSFSDFPIHFGINLWTFQAQHSMPLIRTECSKCSFKNLEYNYDGTTLVAISSIRNPFGESSNYGYLINPESIESWDWNLVEPDFPLQFVEGGNQHNLIVALSPIDNLLAYNSVRDNSVQLFNIETRSNNIVIQGNTAEVSSIAFSPDGTLLVSAGKDGNLVVWDITTQNLARTLQITSSEIKAITFRPDNRVVAIASDEFISLWDIQDLYEITAIHHSGVSFLSFSSDGEFLVSGSSSGTLQLWSLP